MKPLVHYIGKATLCSYDPSRRVLIPMDHPHKELNDQEIITSPVVQEMAGHIETRNTRYVPVKLPTFIAPREEHVAV
jgi:hypothetical protein